MNKNLIFVLLIILLISVSSCLKSPANDESIDSGVDQTMGDVTGNAVVQEAQDDSSNNAVVEANEIETDTNEADDQYETEGEEGSDITSEDIVGQIETGLEQTAKEYAYLVNQNKRMLQVIELHRELGYLTHEKVTDIQVDAEPYEMVFTKDKHYAFITNSGQNTIAIVDLTTNTLVNLFRTREFPRALALSEDEMTLYVGVTVHMESYDVSDVSAIKFKKLYRIPENPSKIVIDYNKNRLYVSSPESDTVTAMDLSSGRILNSIHYEGFPDAIVLDPSGKHLYVAKSRVGKISIVNTESFKEDSEIELTLGSRPAVMKFGPDGRLYVSLYGTNKLLVYDVKSMRVITEVLVGHGPHDFAFNNGYLYVTHINDDFVAVIDTNDFTVENKIDLNEYSLRDIEFK